MTYYVSSGTLNPTHSLTHFSADQHTATTTTCYFVTNQLAAVDISNAGKQRPDVILRHCLRQIIDNQVRQRCTVRLVAIGIAAVVQYCLLSAVLSNLHYWSSGLTSSVNCVTKILKHSAASLCNVTQLQLNTEPGTEKEMSLQPLISCVLSTLSKQQAKECAI